jgi:hypothetical protein
MFERSEFARFPFDPALFRGPAQRAAEPGSPFLGYFFWRDKRSDPLPGGSRQSIHEEPHVLQHRRAAPTEKKWDSRLRGNDKHKETSSAKSMSQKSRLFA